MRTVSGFFNRLCSPESLEDAARSATAGKRRRKDVAWFLFTEEERLAELRADLVARTYQPDPYDLVSIRDPKPRLIARATIRDRIVQTAVVQQLEPVLEPSWTSDDYACRRGYGTHRAVLRLQEAMRRHRFALHLDIRSYFPSIDRLILLQLLERKVRDQPFLELVERVLAVGADLYHSSEHRRLAGLAKDWPPPGRGIAIGAHSSQMLAAHVYLNAFDHWIKRKLKVPAYVRFLDDTFYFADHSSQLERWRRQIADWLMEERGLRLKHPNARILSCHGHLDALGYRIRRSGITCLRRPVRRLHRRIRQHLAGTLDVDLERTIASSVGILLF
ncbi:MAG: reverse transcriptase/maturase family protein [Acidobacteriota bacterium]